MSEDVTCPHVTCIIGDDWDECDTEQINVMVDGAFASNSMLVYWDHKRRDLCFIHRDDGCSFAEAMINLRNGVVDRDIISIKNSRRFIIRGREVYPIEVEFDDVICPFYLKLRGNDHHAELLEKTPYITISRSLRSAIRKFLQSDVDCLSDVMSAFSVASIDFARGDYLKLGVNDGNYTVTIPQEATEFLETCALDDETVLCYFDMSTNHFDSITKKDDELLAIEMMKLKMAHKDGRISLCKRAKPITIADVKLFPLEVQFDELHCQEYFILKNKNQGEQDEQGEEHHQSSPTPYSVKSNELCVQMKHYVTSSTPKVSLIQLMGNFQTKKNT